MSSGTRDSADYLSETHAAHAEAYERGYGVLYPEGHIIRCYELVLRGELGLDGSRGERMFDFGCGVDTHAGYFRTKGFDAYGVDSDPNAIARCKERFPEAAEHFATVDPEPDPRRDFFGGQFDLVLSNQVLYYLSGRDFKTCVENLRRQMKDGGIIVATMMTTSHYLFAGSQPGPDGLRRAPSSTGGRPIVYNINFVASKEEVVERFGLFEPLHVGHYDFSILESQPSRLHYLFVGRNSK